MKVDIYQFTDIGTREVNEDANQVSQNDSRFLAVVCDGLGGHDKGEVASDVVSKAVVKNIDLRQSVNKEMFGNALEQAQKELMQVQKEEKAINAMKTTGVFLWCDGEKAMFAHIGDSRGYRFNSLFGYERTVDHSVPQMLASSGKIKEKDIRFHQDRNSLLRVFGIPWEREMSTISEPFPLKRGQSYLLCTDGFWEWITEQDMRKCLKKASTPEEWVQAMREIILATAEGQEMDNCTAIAIFVR